jgi:antitoxin ParD1/3/4
MGKLSIELPAGLKQKVLIRAAETGHTSVEQYVEDLVRADAEGAGEDPGAPESVRINSLEQTEALLLERLEGGDSIEATPEFWQNLRRQAGSESKE